MSSLPKRKLTPRQQKIVKVAQELVRYGMNKDCAISAAEMTVPKPKSRPSRNSEVLASFVAYCEANPELRFYQALLNWSGHKGRLVFIEDTEDKPRIVDPYAWEGRDG